MTRADKGPYQCFGLVLMLLVMGAGAAHAAPPLGPKHLVIAGVVDGPPFTMKDAHGVWSGIGVDLWNEVAHELKIETQFREMPGFDALIDGLASGAIDVSVGPLVMTPEREMLIDFSHVYLTDRLGIAVRPESELDRWKAIGRSFLSVGFLAALLGLIALLIASGAATWWFERKRNGAFGAQPWRGIGSGFWWSVVTLTSVGYGDKVPASLGGRAIASVWMVLSLVIVSAFTATVTARLAIVHMQEVRSPGDLQHTRVGTVQGSEPADYLVGHGARPREYPSVAASLDATARHDLDATVFQLTALRYTVLQEDPARRLVVIPTDVDQLYMAFGVASDSPLRERINVALLDVMRRPIWDRIRARYLGESSVRAFD